MIRPADMTGFERVRDMTRKTIKEVYPHYYPKGAVDFFLKHHSDENIRKDISENRVFLCFDEEQDAVGTVTIKGNEILRLFVLPEHQGRGFGKELLNFAEEAVSKQYDEIVIDASLSAKAIYLKRGYREFEYHTIKTENGDFLCYDMMKKRSIR